MWHTASSDRILKIRIVTGCICVYIAANGILNNCMGIFFAPMAADLAVPVSALTAMTAFFAAASAACMSLVSRLFVRYPCRYIMSVLAAVYLLPHLLMSFCHSVPALYVLNALQGAAGGFMLVYPVQHILSEWFPKSKGRLLGFVTTFSATSAAVMNPVISGWILNLGWRMANMLTTLIAALFLIPACACLLYKDPAEAGFAADAGVGTDAVNKGDKVPTRGPSITPRSFSGSGDGMSASPISVDNPGETHLRQILPVLFIVVLAFYATTSTAQHLSGHAVSAGYSITFGAFLISAANMGNLTGKLLFGPLNDRIGAPKTMLLMLLPVTAALAVLSIAKAQWLMLLCAVFTGFISSASALEIPLLSRYCCGDSFGKYYPVISMAGILVGGVSIPLLSLIYDLTGSYRPMFLCVAALLCVCIIGIVFILRLNEKGKRKEI